MIGLWRRVVAVDTVTFTESTFKIKLIFNFKLIICSAQQLLRTSDTVNSDFKRHGLFREEGQAAAAVKEGEIC